MNKLLVVDDNEVDLFIIDKLLEKGGFFPDRTLTTNARNAIEFVEEHRFDIEKLPDVLLLDLAMPGLDGFQFLERLNAIYTARELGMDVYIMTCSLYNEDKEAAEKYPFVKAVMVKPLNMTVLSQIFAHAGSLASVE